MASLLEDINKKSQEAASSGLIDKEKYVVPPHLHDLQENDLPETQRGLVMTEIAQFRERAAKREREKMRDVQQAIPAVMASAGPPGGAGGAQGVPSGPKQREWGKPQLTGARSPENAGAGQGFGKGAQGYSKPVGFVKAESGEPGLDGRTPGQKAAKTDEELEAERKEARRRDEENSFRDVSVEFCLLSLVFWGACAERRPYSVNDGTSLESGRGSRRWKGRLRGSER